MKISAIKTIKVLPCTIDIYELLNSSLPTLKERSILAITSKVLSICEGRVVDASEIDKEELIRRESELYYLPKNQEYRYHFTITNNTLIPSAGIDESNGNGWYVLWPENPQLSANKICAYLKKRYNLKELGVLITDSTILPSRWGTLGIGIGYSGFSPVKDYIGTKDLFGRDLKVSTSNIAGGLAAAAVLAMGEGAEQTPLALIEDISSVTFLDTYDEKQDTFNYYISPLNDEPFAPFFNSVEWSPGGRNKRYNN